MDADSGLTVRISVDGIFKAGHPLSCLIGSGIAEGFRSLNTEILYSENSLSTSSR
jgi:hypothetical protein